ncbi:hypothetical protein NDU88_003104 [Pleurodeles waltl]|uniref:SMB domain-containing protein n=1 Tax=Pleurodeles waltl TaxID=8319 RepID=A0AAV7UCT8_PLEWA|nr:hypothetical protein NDU88_003104 [Pleurodeles waltl]
MKALLLLATVLGTICSSVADEELCVGRCTEGFNITRKCQCDPLCVYYQSCCSDYATACKQIVTRGDVFALPDDEYGYETYDEATGSPLFATEPAGSEHTVADLLEKDPVEIDPTEIDPVETETVTTYLEEAGTVMIDPVQIDLVEAEVPLQEATETTVVITKPPPTVGPTESGVSESESPAPEIELSPEQEEEDLCSGKPFDAFTDLKNGSIYAFRGKYFYELDEKKARDGYPKLIQDVWGIPGPIDAAFTRINCEGKTYIFKGGEYWRFDNGVLDPGFPRNISRGFDKIPNDIDAAFAVPAKDYGSSERVYFFKGSRYWEYDFKHQPSLKDCRDSSPSLAFTQYALMQMEDDWSQFFQRLFGGSKNKGSSNPISISRAWRGLPSNLDAAVAGKLYLPQPSKQTRRNRRRKSRRNRRKYQLRKRKSYFKFFDWMSEEDEDDVYFDPDWVMPVAPRCQPIQSVYFFKKDKYYRVNLDTKRVDYVYPKYPRPIAQYWLGCVDSKKLA